MGKNFKAGSGLDATIYQNKPSINVTVPTGALIMRGGSTFSTASIDVTGVCPCDGRALSRTTYAPLFDVIGTIWGAGDGSTTFNVPSLHSNINFLSGANTNANIAATTGSTTHSHTVSTEATLTTGSTSMSHVHTYDGNLDSADNPHGHNQFAYGSWYTGNSNAPSQTQYKTDGTQANAAINHVHSGYVPNANSGNAVAGYSYAHGHYTSGELSSPSGTTHTHNVAYTSTISSATAYPPYVAVLYYIKL